MNHLDADPDGRAVLVQEPDGVLPPRRAALGAAPRGARAQRGPVEARRRDGEPGLVRRRRPALVRVGARRLGRPRDRDHGDAGHRHGHARRRWRRSPPRSSACRSTASTSCSATRRAGRTRRSRPARRRRRAWGRRCARRPRTRRGRSSSSPPSASTASSACSSLKGGNIVSADGGSWPLEEICGLLERRADPRQGRARPEPDRHARADVRRPGGRGGRGRRDGRGARRARRRDPRRRPDHQPARRVEPGRGRDHPGDRPHALRGAAASTRRPGRC